MKILLVSPPHPDTFWSFKHVLPFVSKRAAFPPLGLLTIAALLPRPWQLKLVDMNVDRLLDEDLAWADYVMLSAMIVHKEAVAEIVHRCAALGRPIIAGGPLFTTGHTDFSGIPHLVLGEAEELMPEIVEDMRQGAVRHIYSADSRPDITRVPVPRWDLVNMKHYVTMSVQFSRGCPFDCEFCDIVVMNGRVPRTKTPGQLIEELEQLRLHGWHDMVFLVDDNFIGNRRAAKELLREMIHWRQRTGTRMGFLTEASADLADDPELYQLMVQAGFKKVFVGFETPATESLRECGKLQNCRRDLAESVRILQGAGLEVMGGFIIGFDNDPLDIFKRQFDFIQRSGVVTAMVGLLTALPETRLYRRLMQEGRLERESSGNNTDTELNFRPKISRGYLTSGYRELMRTLYEPGNYYRRIRTFLKHNRPAGPRLRLSRSDLQAFFKSLWLLGVWHRGRWAYWRLLFTTLLTSPRRFHQAIELAIIGYHFRRLSDLLK